MPEGHRHRGIIGKAYIACEIVAPRDERRR